VQSLHIERMKLAEYLAAHGMNDDDFALRVGRDRTTVLRWRKGRTQPDWAGMQAIMAATSGEVMPNDFISDDFQSEAPPPFPISAGAE